MKRFLLLLFVFLSLFSCKPSTKKNRQTVKVQGNAIAFGRTKTLAMMRSKTIALGFISGFRYSIKDGVITIKNGPADTSLSAADIIKNIHGKTLGNNFYFFSFPVDRVVQRTSAPSRKVEGDIALDKNNSYLFQMLGKALKESNSDGKDRKGMIYICSLNESKKNNQILIHYQLSVTEEKGE